VVSLLGDCYTRYIYHDYCVHERLARFGTFELRREDEKI